jgi:hypothetical protein
MRPDGVRLQLLQSFQAWWRDVDVSRGSVRISKRGAAVSGRSTTREGRAVISMGTRRKRKGGFGAYASE